MACTLLIPTIVDDVHAAAVSVALERMGHRGVRWFCGDVPERSAASFSLGGIAPESLSLQDGGARLDLDEIDVFWNRRLGAPIITADLLDCDKEIAARESERFVRGILSTVSRHAYAVNGHHQARVAEDKFFQLSTARELGFELPPTLISNDPQAVRNFVHSHEAQGAVVKCFSPVSWEGADRIAINFTARIREDVLPRDGLLRLTPAIYQAYVPKAYEVRVTCMGDELVAVALHSQRQDSSRTDWRVVSPQALEVTRIALPVAVAHSCRALLRRLDLRFGCIDFIVTPEGEHVFLEINQMGQFLWIEEAQPELPMLQMFCDFLVSRDPFFRYSRMNHEQHYAEVLEPACERMAADMDTHLRPARNINVYHE